MPRSLISIGLLSLVASALAVPVHPSGSGAPYHVGNSTEPFGTGAAASTGFHRRTRPWRFSAWGPKTASTEVTVTVLPVPTATAISPEDASTTTCTTTPTVTVTSKQLFTVTVTAEPAPSSLSDIASAAAPSSSAVEEVSSAPEAVSTSSVAYATDAVSSETSPSITEAVSSTAEISPSITEAASSTAEVASSTTEAASVESDVTDAQVAQADANQRRVRRSSTTIKTSTKPAATSTPPPPPPTSAKASSPAAATSTPAPAPSTPAVSIGKRGVPYNDAKLTTCFANTKVSWVYNWANSGSGYPAGMEFVPMLWGNGASFTTPWAAAASKAIASGSTHLLGFNEPDLGSQANMDVGTTVSAWKSYMQPFAGKAKLVSPAVTNGGTGMGLDYLGKFLTQCTGCTIDAVAIHWYDSATNFAYFKNHINDAIKTANGRPVWLTEFGASGSDDQVKAFLQQAIPFLESTAGVERYAYFMASDGLLVKGTDKSAYGTTYATL